MVFKGKKKNEIKEWLEKFQQTVNLAAGNHHLKFTAEIWTDGANPPTPEKEDRGQIVTEEEFTFLDMKMSWSPERDLQFGVFGKKVQQFKYVGKESTRCVSALFADVFQLLSFLSEDS